MPYAITSKPTNLVVEIWLSVFYVILYVQMDEMSCNRAGVLY